MSTRMTHAKPFMRRSRRPFFPELSRPVPRSTLEPNFLRVLARRGHRTRLGRISRSRRSLFASGTSFLAWLFFGAVNVALAAGETDAVLDEIIAGIEANQALLQHGEARYVRTTTRYFQPNPRTTPDYDSVPRGPYTSKQAVFFDYPRVRIDAEENGRVYGDQSAVIKETLIFDGERLIQYAPPRPRTDGSPISVRSHLVFIGPTDDARLAQRNHPRRQLSELPPPQETLRRMRRNKAATLTAKTQPDGLIAVTFEHKPTAYRQEYWFSPTEGYSLVRSRQWTLSLSETEPASSDEARTKQVTTGAYVISWHHGRSLIAIDGSYRPNLEMEDTLTDIDVEITPAENLFTLESLRLPVGAKIQDKIVGRDYKYQVPDVDEKKIVVRPASGPTSIGYWATGAYVVAGLGLVLVGYAWRRRRARSPVAP